jgi:hypothetical protein
MVMNPFYEEDSVIVSPEFDKRVKTLAKKYF